MTAKRKRTRSQIGAASRRKGQRFMQEMARWLNDNGWAEKAAVRPQYRGASRDGADIEDGPVGLFIECKAVEDMSTHQAMKKAAKDTKDEGKGRVPVVFHKRNRQGVIVAFYLDDADAVGSLTKTARVWEAVDAKAKSDRDDK